ncbi:MAG: PD40 domain-containing protein [Chloroflexi bacterium]|nr:PD40 domain-containing protein [Chloroflexota bacterium]
MIIIHKTCFALLVCLAALILFGAPRAEADVAPNPEAAASDISPEQGTQVQMASERVVLDIQMRPFQRYGETFTGPVANVTADFTMRNLGSADETMEVRFPKSFPTAHGFSPIVAGNAIESIETFVNGAPVANHQETFDDTPWAVWQVNFPAGRDVNLRVQYRTLGTDFYGSIDFYYILQTGAGWRGPIGQGDIVFQFPYPADLDMVESKDTYIRAEYPSTTPPFVAEGNQLRWHFENLEPTPKDNVRLLILRPDLWQAILDARAQAQLQPNNAAAQIQLGQQYRKAIPIKKGWPHDSTIADRFGASADAAFRRAVTLAPNDFAAHLAYARFLTDHTWSLTPEPYYTQARREIARALELNPTSKDAYGIVKELDTLSTFSEIAAKITPAPAAANSLGVIAYMVRGDVWVKALPNGQAKQRTRDGHNHSPRWSPSGRWIAFRGRDDEIRVMSASGGDAQSIPNSAASGEFVWSPEDDTLAFTTRQGNLSIASPPSWREQPIVQIANQAVLAIPIAWSPNGKSLGFIQEELPRPDSLTQPLARVAILWIVQPNAPTAATLYRVEFPEEGGMLVADWLDNKRILLFSDPYLSGSILADGVPLYAFSTRESATRQFADAMLLHDDFRMVSPNRKFLAVTQGSGRETWTNKQIAVIDLTKGIKTQLTDSQTAAFSPAWSPDNARLAYSAAPDIGSVGGGDEAHAGAAKRRIWVMKRDGGSKRQLTNDAAYRDERPLWSANATHLLFARLEGDDTMSLWLMRDDGSELQLVANALSGSADDGSPPWFGYYGHIDWDTYFDWWRPTFP